MSDRSVHQALVHVMVTMSAADRTMTDHELAKIGNIVNSLPIFGGYDQDNLMDDAKECSAILQGSNGLGDVISNVLDNVPEALHETVYALAVEVAAADLNVEQEELRLLQLLRDSLNLDRLSCAAIERGARARHRTL
ncbi:MAG: tellurite resistance TerB family protein [Rhizobiaceae bacterium]|nr:tellurite resistance TerB family protein [Rhizobiaceae bacterium]